MQQSNHTYKLPGAEEDLKVAKGVYMHLKRNLASLSSHFPSWLFLRVYFKVCTDLSAKPF